MEVARAKNQVTGFPSTRPTLGTAWKGRFGEGLGR